MQSCYVSDAHTTREERVFAVGLLPTAPARVTEDIQVRRPEIETTHDAGVSFAQILHVLDAALDTNLPGHRVNTRSVECRG